VERFSRLYDRLDETQSTLAKVDAMAAYFEEAPPGDAAWAVFFLTGERLKRSVPTAALRAWCGELTGLPPWLVEETYAHVGDLAETVALLLHTAGVVGDRDREALPPLAELVEGTLLPLPRTDEAERRRVVTSLWQRCGTRSAFLVNKLLTGGLRVGVSRALVLRALAQASGVPRDTLAHRLMGRWAPSAEAFSALVDPDASDGDPSRPYPFFLGHPLEQEPSALGPTDGWLAEWKWDGIRAQLVRREGGVYLWSRGGELLDGRFPELETAAVALPDGCVLDGEVLAWRDGPLDFRTLQARINKQRPGPALLAKAPCVFLAFDLLEADGEDVRGRPLDVRRARLAELVPAPEDDREAILRRSTGLAAEDWDALARARAQARDRGVEGLVLKRRDSTYGTGRQRGAWWKWKLDPYTVDAVLIYAQAGHGRRANQFTDYTFAVRDGDGLVPVAKAYSGLTHDEIAELDAWIRGNTLERFGPVRSVPAEQVFELAFENIAPSPRHKSGIALRFPRIVRWRRDLAPADADELRMLQALVDQRAPS
jgi:DNA ligase-1